MRACGEANKTGTTLTAGLPNIVGQARRFIAIHEGGNSGALFIDNHATEALAGQAGANGASYFINIDASRSNDIYGKSASVIPNSVNIQIIIYLGTK